MESNSSDKYEILRYLATVGSAGKDLQETSQKALGLAAKLVGLKAAGMYLWDEKMAITLSVTSAESEEAKQKLVSLEESLFRSLRQDNQLLSAYMSFGGDEPCHSFTLPLRHGEEIFGAVIGLQQGEPNLVAEDLFLQALCAAITLNVVASGIGGSISKKQLDQERLTAVLETAVTVNHEINNPLTAILGNVQLLLIKRDNLDNELVTKLKIVEESALRIKDVTQKLLRLTTTRSTSYAEGATMIDLSDETSGEDESKSES